MSILLRLSCVVFALFISACASVDINADYDTRYPFQQLKTYAWMLEPAAVTGDPRIDRNTLLESRVHAAVDRQLKAKGYVLIEDGTPDFFVTYYATLNTRTATTVINDYYHYGPYDWPRYSSTYVYEYEEGTLIVDFVEPDTRKLIWRGSARDEVNFTESPQAKEKKIDEAARLMLSDFPPGRAKQK